MARPARTQTTISMTRWRHLMRTLSSIKTMTISGMHSGSSHTGKQHGTIMAKKGLYLIMSVAPEKVPQPHALSRTDSASSAYLPPRAPARRPHGQGAGNPQRLGDPLKHLKDTTPPTYHPHPSNPRMRKRDPHAGLLTNVAFRWSLDPHPHQTETFPVHPGGISSQCPTWTFPLSVSYVSEKTTQQLHARIETVYAINVIREGTSLEHVSYRTRGLAASPPQWESFQWIF